MAERLVALLAAAVTATAGCSSPSPTPPPPKTETQTVTVAPAPAPASASAPPAPPSMAHSSLIDVTLPPGSTVSTSSASPGQPPFEIWTVPTSYQYTVDSVRKQLPISHDYYKIPFCSQQYNGKLGLTQWDWSDASNVIVVAVDQRGTVTITRGPDDEGRQGCDSP